MGPFYPILLQADKWASPRAAAAAASLAESGPFHKHTHKHTHTQAPHTNTHTRTQTRTQIATRPAAPRVWSAKDDANLLRLCRRFLFDFERVAVELSTRFEVTTADACRLQYAVLEMRESVLLL